ncbi:FAD-dependent monooxygenase [Nocardioides immobilis]|nr:FAD-dependent monooxygenase [Nocardioides immobilis]
MKVSIVGGGPGGLYLASLIRERTPGASVEVFERNEPEATYGFGVVFSEPTLRNLVAGDPGGFDALFATSRRWPGIDIRIKGRSFRAEGNGFAAIERRTLLRALLDRARAAGAVVHSARDVAPGDPVLADADVVVVADGSNSLWRRSHEATLGASVEQATAKFIWFGSTKVFDGMTFLFEKNADGWFAVHAYPYNDKRSTFVVETDQATWQRSGLDAFDVTQPPGLSDEGSAAYVERLFAKHLDGGRMILNNSRWANFRTVRTNRWRIDGRTVLLGDAAHTAHFSVGSGTKMALEDALELAGQIDAVAAGKDLQTALADYERIRLADVRRIQSLARPSLSWWEHFGEYATALAPSQFAFHFLTRSGRVGRRRLADGDPGFIARTVADIAGDPSRDGLRMSYLLGCEPFVDRVVALDAGQHAATVDAGRLTLPDLRGGVPAGGYATVASAPGLPKIVWTCAPTRLDAVSAHVSDLVTATEPNAVVVVEAAPPGDDAGGYAETAVAQRRTSELLRLRHGHATIAVLAGPDADLAESLVLAGRADLVAVQASDVDGMLMVGDQTCAESPDPPFDSPAHVGSTPGERQMLTADAREIQR